PSPFALPPSLEGVPVAHAESINTANKVKLILDKNLFMCILPLSFIKLCNLCFLRLKIFLIILFIFFFFQKIYYICIYYIFIYYTFFFFIYIYTISNH